MYDLIVIGAGPGGYEAAAHAARLGAKVAVIEKDKLGGTCLNTGCIPAKTFLRSSKLFHEVASAEAFGVRVGVPEFHLPSLQNRKDRVIGTLTRGVQGMLRRAGVETINGHATLLSRSEVGVGGQRLQARNLLLATGSRPAPVPIPGTLDSDTIFSLEQIPETLAIIGGGYIGLEFACFFSELGTQVTVFEMLPQIAAASDRDVSSHLLKTLQKRGIQFRLGTRFSEPERFAAVLNATGRVPLTEGLGIEAVGLDASRRGIRTDDRGRTNVPGIWACGDVTGRRMLAHAAVREGIVAVNNMMGQKDRIRYDSIPAVIYTHPEVASVGRTEEELHASGIEYRKSVVPMASAGRFLVENEDASGMVKVLTGARYREILGVHAVGDASSEFIVAAAALIEHDVSATRAASIVFPHPTVSEALREAILGVH
jgi:dihydrolipoamide dehydrogenase